MNIIAAVCLLRVGDREPSVENVRAILDSIGSETSRSPEGLASIESIVGRLKLVDFQQAIQALPSLNLKLSKSGHKRNLNEIRRSSVIRPVGAGVIAPHFTEVWSQIKAQRVYRIYETRPSDLVLVAVDEHHTHTPLFVMSLQCANPATGCAILKSSSNTSETFHGLVQQDRQTLQPSFHNLSGLDVSFSILEKSQEINEVNVLKAHSSYRLPCDQRTRKEMILTVGTTTTTLSEDSKKKENDRGVYCWEVVIHPVKSLGSTPWRAKTEWRAGGGLLVTSQEAREEDYPHWAREAPEEEEDDKDKKMEGGEKEMEAEAEDEEDNDDEGFSLFGDEEKELIDTSLICHVESGASVRVSSQEVWLDLDTEVRKTCKLTH